MITPPPVPAYTILATVKGSTMPVIGQRPGWIDVRLPGRPNESTKWIKKDTATLTETGYAIVINLTTEHLSLYDGGKRVGDYPVGIGAANTPTPTGNYYIRSFDTPPAAGYGPFVMVTSAHSNTITDWDFSGDAQVAIHGPLGADKQIGTTGTRISHGCVRMHINDLLKLRDVPDGTPVDIVA